MSNNEIVSYYQPIISANSGIIYHLQVLNRRQGKWSGLFTDHFLKFIKYRMKQELTEFLMKSVAREVKKSSTLLSYDIYLTMNFSMTTLPYRAHLCVFIVYI